MLAAGAGEAVTAVFFECLCLDGLGEAPGVGLESVVCANADETEKMVNRIRGISFFMALELLAAGKFSQYSIGIAERQHDQASNLKYIVLNLITILGSAAWSNKKVV